MESKFVLAMLTTMSNRRVIESVFRQHTSYCLNQITAISQMYANRYAVFMMCIYRLHEWK